MLYREIIAVCSEIHTKYINTLCGQNVELLNVKQVVHIVTIGLWRVNDADFTVYCCWLWALNAGTCDVYLLCNDYASDFHHTILRPTFRVTVFHPATHTLLPSPDPAAHPRCWPVSCGIWQCVLYSSVAPWQARGVDVCVLEIAVSASRSAMWYAYLYPCCRSDNSRCATA